MEILLKSIAFSFAFILSTLVLKFLNWVWLRPKRIEKLLREQGFSGNSYRPLIGDLVEVAHSILEANRMEPLENLSNHISPRILPFLYKTVSRYGKKSFLWIGPRAAVIILEPEMVKEMLANYQTFQRPNIPAATEIIRGLFTCEADKWPKNRRIINPAFHMEKLKVMVPAFYATSVEMLEKWEKIIVQQPEGSSVVDIWPHLNILPSDAIGRCLGTNFEQRRKMFDDFSVLMKLVTDLGPFMLFPPYWILPTKIKRKIQQTSREVTRLVGGIVGKRMEVIREGKSGTKDLLGFLLESNLKESKSGNMKEGLSNDDLVEECKLFYLAAQEAITNLMGWTLILLSKHFEWQQRARDEVMQVFGLAPIHSHDFYKLNQLKIMSMIFYEVLRLYPPIVAIYRETLANTNLGNINLSKGVNVMVPLLSLHGDKDLWGDDVFEFKPERFKDGISKASKIPGAYYPFGGGPRMCIGMNYALVESKVAMAAILQRFSFQLSSSYKHSPQWTITIHPPNANLILRKL